ncbi:amidohydrolase/deacetylase family metallohydrolase [Prosthecomicrobium sp. N25]|uniref:amidohydrolase/deacetylase family metallohydrolase n=1 Tax=Prosthecomicrobium sp. N25 TaxID=3129254 RepID=UPI0030772260
MLDTLFKARPVAIEGVRPVGFEPGLPAGAEAIDIVIDTEGRIAGVGRGLAASAPEGALRVAGAGWVSPGWADLHTHLWYGGTDISIRPEQAGLGRGVTTLVDAGSAGEANFHGFREFIVEPAREKIVAFLNVGSIGLVACNRVSELIDMRSIDIDRTLACVEANRDVVVGLKVRASAVILGAWGLTPVRLAKKLSRITKLPLMVHVGEPPPLYDDIVALLGPGDIVTHCFNGKAGGSLVEDEDLYRLVETAAERGVLLDVGHGGASYSFEVGEAAIARGLLPHTISTDLHNRSLDGAVWDLATTMSKLLAAGMPFEAVVDASTTRPRSAVALPSSGFLEVGRTADLTVFDLVDGETVVKDSQGRRATLHRMFEPRFAVLGRHATEAHRHTPPAGQGGPAPCPHCGWVA